MLLSIYRVGFFIGKIFPLKVCYVLAEVIGRLYFIFAVKTREALRENLRVVLGPDISLKELDKHVVGVFVNFGKYLADFFKLCEVTKKQIEENVEIKGVHHIDEALRMNKGVILFSAHLGNWELGAAVIAALGYSLNAVILEHENKNINDLFTRRRQGYNVNGIPMGIKVKQCFRVLKNNQSLAIVGDKDYSGSSQCVEFFGKEALMPKGAAVIGFKTGAPIVVVTLVRKKDDTFFLQIEEPIICKKEDNYDKGVKFLMRACLSKIEERIRAYPDQWYVFDKIWKLQ